MICLIRLILVAAGSPMMDMLQFLEERLAEIYPVFIRTEPDPLPIPPSVYDPERNQLRSERFLEYLRPIQRTLDHQAKLLALVDADAYAAGTNFVFGQAELGGRVGAVYIKRLYLGLDPQLHDDLFKSRVLKEASHELGHLLGLDHCATPRCVMRFSNSLSEVDAKSHLLCDLCQSKLGVLIGREA